MMAELYENKKRHPESGLAFCVYMSFLHWALYRRAPRLLGRKGAGSM